MLSALVLREPVTWRKAVGVALGCMGALLLVWSSARAAGASVGTGNLRGDLLCLAAQFSYSIYLTVFGRLAKRYSVVTVNKWMFLSATCIIWPFTGAHVLSTPWAEVPLKTYAETAYVVVCGTFAAYLLMIRRATGVAPHGGEHVQLCAAHCGGLGEHSARPGGADRDACPWPRH